MSEVDYNQDLPSAEREPHTQAHKIDITLEKAQSTASNDLPCRCCPRHVREARRPPVGVWPVAQIIVEFEAVQTAWGRQSVQAMGYMVSFSVLDICTHLTLNGAEVQEGTCRHVSNT